LKNVDEKGGNRQTAIPVNRRRSRRMLSAAGLPFPATFFIVALPRSLSSLWEGSSKNVDEKGRNLAPLDSGVLREHRDCRARKTSEASLSVNQLASLAGCSPKQACPSPSARPGGRARPPRRHIEAVN